jgi:hypothetical protein
MPIMKGSGSDLNPPSGGCTIMATMAFTTGAPPKTIGITAEGASPFIVAAAAPSARISVNAPTAPAVPAMKLHVIPEPVILQLVPRALSTMTGPTIATTK